MTQPVLRNFGQSKKRRVTLSTIVLKLFTADHGRDLHPLADHTTKLRNFTMCENCDFSAFRVALQLRREQALSNLIVCLMIS